MVGFTSASDTDDSKITETLCNIAKAFVWYRADETNSVSAESLDDDSENLG